MPSLDVLGNVTLPLRPARKRPDRRWLHEVIDRVGLSNRMQMVAPDADSVAHGMIGSEAAL